MGEDVPDDVTRVTSDTWQRAIGITKWKPNDGNHDDHDNHDNDQDKDDDQASSSQDHDHSVICLFPSPSFQVRRQEWYTDISHNEPPLYSSCLSSLGRVCSHHSHAAAAGFRFLSAVQSNN